MPFSLIMVGDMLTQSPHRSSGSILNPVLLLYYVCELGTHEDLEPRCMKGALERD